jgi:hypothetical protein
MPQDSSMTFTRIAKNIRIGDAHEISGGKDPETVKVLHEVCMLRPSPHVHVVTNKTTRCYGFNQRF